MKIASFATTIAVLAIGASAQAVTLANWTFETSIPTTAGPHAAEAGVNAASSFASGFHADQGAVYSNPVGNGSAESFSSNFWNTVGDYYQFTFSAAGYQNVTFAWDQARSSTGPSDFTLAVSTDGTNFTNVLSNYVVQINTSPNAWNGTTQNTLFSFAPQALNVNNAANVTVRLVSNVALTATAGTNRVDNVIVDAEAIPEPATMMVLGLGLAAAAARRKRK